MLEKDVILSKINIIQNCLKTIDKATKGDPNSIDDFFVGNVVTLNLQRAAQAAIDMAQVVVSARSLGLPNSYKMTFTILSREGLLDEESTKNMQSMVGFRNIAVHDYREISKDILKKIITDHLGDFKKYYDQIIKLF